MTVTVHQAKTHLSRYLAAVEDGQEIVIARGKRPVARLVSVESDVTKAPRPRVGETLDAPFVVPMHALTPLNARELQDFGL